MRSLKKASISKSKLTSGFTLIEALIYIAILALVLTASVLGAYNIIESTGRGDTDVFVEEEANFILRKVSWVLSGTSAINSPSPGASGSTLSVTKADYANNPVVISLNGDKAMMGEGGGALVPLNSEYAPIENLVFSHQAGGPSPLIVATITIDGRTFSISRQIR